MSQVKQLWWVKESPPNPLCGDETGCSGEHSLGNPLCKGLILETHLRSKPGSVLRKEAWSKGVGAEMAALFA